MQVIICIIAVIVANWFFVEMPVVERGVIGVGVFGVTALVCEQLGFE